MFFVSWKPQQLLKALLRKRKRYTALVKRVLKNSDSSIKLQQWQQVGESYLVAYATTSTYWHKIFCTSRTHWFYVIDLDFESVAAKYWILKSHKYFRVETTTSGEVYITVIHSDGHFADVSRFTFDSRQQHLATSS